jgi:hypothetical protein
MAAGAISAGSCTGLYQVIVWTNEIVPAEMATLMRMMSALTP